MLKSTSAALFLSLSMPHISRKILNFYCIKQIDFIFPSSVQLQMHRGRQNVRRTAVSVSWATFLFLPRSDVICASITEQTTAKWNVFVKYYFKSILIIMQMYRLFHRCIQNYISVFKFLYLQLQLRLWLRLQLYRYRTYYNNYKQKSSINVSWNGYLENLNIVLPYYINKIQINQISVPIKRFVYMEISTFQHIKIYH